MGDPWKQYAKWKKPDIKYHLLYDSIYEISRIGEPIETERLVFDSDWQEKENWWQL